VLGNILSFANGRVYAIKASGGSSEPSSSATGGFSCNESHCSSSAFRAGWPAKIGLINAGLLPDVGEGINGSPVVAPVTCPGGARAEGRRDARSGPGYILNADAAPYGSTEGKYNALETDISAGAGKVDTPPSRPSASRPSARSTAPRPTCSRRWQGCCGRST